MVKIETYVVMMTLLNISLVVAVLALLVGSVIQRRLSAEVQPLRIELANRGEDFLARTDLPRVLRTDVEDMLETAFPCNCLFGVLLLPLIPFFVWAGWKRSNRRATEIGFTGEEVRTSYAHIRALHRRIAIANHPVLQPLTDLIAVASMMVLVLALVAFRKRVAPNLDPQSAAQNVDHAFRWAHDRLPGGHGLSPVNA